MVKCSLRWSRWDFGFVSVCHLLAASTVLQARLLIAPALVLVAAVLVSYLCYLADRIRTYAVHSRGIWRRANPQLLIGEQAARLDWLGETREMQLPVVIYFSEFLLVLKLRPEFGNGASSAVHLAVWPDSLKSSENRRLRRYLRFELPADLSDG